MSHNEIAIFAVLAGFGTIVGMFAGVVGARKDGDLITALFTSGLIAAVGPLIVWFVCILVQGLRNGAGLIAAVLSALFFTVVLMVTVPFIAGIPALISAAVCFRITERRMRSRRKDG